MHSRNSIRTGGTAPAPTSSRGSGRRRVGRYVRGEVGGRIKIRVLRQVLETGSAGAIIEDGRKTDLIRSLRVRARPSSSVAGCPGLCVLFFGRRIDLQDCLHYVERLRKQNAGVLPYRVLDQAANNICRGG